MRIKPTLTFFLVLFILLARQVSAQQSGISISGKVKAADTDRPIRAASVSVNKKGIGTATNRDGAFVLIVPAANLKDSLKISCLGYQTMYLPISSFVSGQEKAITIQKNSVELKEVNIAYYDPAKIIQKAIDRIPQNYINHTHVTRGFYRMYTAKGNEPLELSEAVFDIFNFGYADKHADLFKLIKARDEKNQRDFHSLELGQKPNTIFNYDVVNHIAASGFLSDAGLLKHTFKVNGIVDVKGYPAYEVEFNEKDGAKGVSFSGKFYVDTKSYAFIYFDYGLSSTAIQNAEFGSFADKILLGTAGIQVGIKQDNTKVGYQKVGDKWVLSDVVGNDALSIVAPDLNYDFVANINFNYQVTSVDTTQTASFDSKLNSHANINDHDSNAGEEFWKDYNILLADFKTEDVFKYIQDVNKETRLGDKFEEKLRKMDPDTLQRAEALLKFYADNGQFNGTALIKSKGKVILSKSYGYADKEKRTQASSHTTYNIGSAAVPFTSVIINQLISEGKLDVHAPIKTYIPYYTHGDVTVEQLLTNQSGIPDGLKNADYKKKITATSYTLKDMIMNFCSDSLNFESGTQFEYSNSNFQLLALIAQEVARKPFNALLQDRIFTPLQMADTYFGNYNGTGTNQAKSYVNNVAQPTYDVANEAGAGGISSSAEDLLKFHDALLTNKLLPQKQKDEMLKTRVQYNEKDGWYDYGWVTDKDAFDATKKHVITYHLGTGTGFYTMFVRQEDADNCIILLNNTGNFPIYDMADLLLSILN